VRYLPPTSIYRFCIHFGDVVRRYGKVDYEQLVVFSCRMVGRDAGELLQVCHMPSSLRSQPTHCNTHRPQHASTATRIDRNTHQPQHASTATTHGKCFQVLDERARDFDPFIARAAEVAAASVKSTRVVFSASNDAHMNLLRRIWKSVMLELPFPGHEHADWEHEIGFQGRQPHTDLRKMGVFALEQLAYVPCVAVAAAFL
jgi:hypothetical protein